jgi:colicin import membrane protein
MSEDQPISSKTKKKFYKRPVFWVGAVILVIIISVTSGGSKNDKTITTSDSANKTGATSDTAKQQSTTPAPSTSTQTTQPTTIATNPTPATSAAPAVTVSQKNALSKAKDYLSYTAFSHDGLVDQLVYEQFSAADATYGADNSGADWNAQAAKKAKDYMSYSSFSRGSLIDQLEYDKFTPDQATYGVNAVGL